MALKLTRENLLYDYDDHAASGDDPKARWSPDNKRLNRSESYEVLALLQHLVDERDMDHLEDVHALEHLIHTKYKGLQDRLSLLSLLDSEQSIAETTRDFREMGGKP